MTNHTREKPLIFIDTEFNGFGGELISMALIDEDGREFYEALPIAQEYDPWVKLHVLPHVQKLPCLGGEFKAKLQEYLSRYQRGFTLIADWPDDIRYFMQEVITGPGQMMRLPSFDCRVLREVSSAKSTIPHNALEDAKAIRIDFYDEYPPEVIIQAINDAKATGEK